MHKKESRVTEEQQIPPFQYEIDKIITVIRNWDTIIDTSCGYNTSQALRKAYKPIGYRFIKNYIVVETNGRGRQSQFNVSHVREGNKSGGGKKILCSNKRVFDTISYHHQQVGHKSHESTFNNVKEVYFNITQQKQVKAFCSLCPTCALPMPENSRQKLKGASHHLKSRSFRDRIQVDLISYEHIPAMDAMGVLTE